MRAFVSLIGAGPGDVDLLTLKGKKALERADVVLYDYLANAELLRLAPHAEQIFVGKKGFSAYISQEDINALLVQKAQENKRVVRLKGGDVFVFGRGGEEAEACVAAGIPFEVVPGITSAIAALAYAGIPITHRQAGSSFAVLTGNEMLRDHEHLNYAHYAGIDTLVFLMGVRSLPTIVEKLMQSGKSADTPAATIQWGTHSRQKVVLATVGTLVEAVQQAGIEAPAVTVVGEVARYREQLRWFDNRPLFGRKVAVTRTREQSSGLIDLLREQGADVLEVPLIRYEATDDAPTLYRTLSDVGAGAYRWVIFSSQYAVHETFRQLDEMGQDARIFAQVRIAAVGPATAQALEEHGLRADYLPSTPGAKHLGETLPVRADQRMVHFTSQLAEEALEQALAARGLQLERVTAYQTLAAELTAEQREALAQAEVVTLASGSAARAFASQIGNQFAVVVMGPQTEAAAQSAGFSSIHSAATPSLEALVEAVKAYLLP